MSIKVGRKYRCIRENRWINVGAVVIASPQGRWKVRVEDTPHAPFDRGLSHLDEQHYNFHVDANCFELIKREVINMENLTDEQVAELHRKANSGDMLTAEEYQWFMDNDPSAVSDYAMPADDDEHCYFTENLYWCEVGEEWYASDDDFRDFRGSRGELGRAHIDNLRRDSDYFHCWHTEIWYNDYRYTSVYLEDVGETVCLDECDGDVYYSDEDDCYYWHYDNVSERDTIPSYHSQSRNWKVPDGITFGIELEVYVDDAEQAYTNRASDIIGERDGSLDSQHGVEFIGPPMLYDDYFKPTNPWKRTLEGIRDAGGDGEQDDGYGIHISVGRQALSSDVQARFILFINNCQEFSEWIAGRPQNRWAEYDKKDVDTVTKAMRIVGNSDYWGSKYAATHVTNQRIEVRIFRSTTDDAMFQKNIDYVASAVQYAEEHLFVEDMMSVSNYLAWLNKQEKYAALRAFVADRGSEFAAQDERRKQLATAGFIIEQTNNDPSI